MYFLNNLVIKLNALEYLGITLYNYHKKIFNIRVKHSFQHIGIHIKWFFLQIILNQFVNKYCVHQIYLSVKICIDKLIYLSILNTFKFANKKNTKNI